jgi:hypothetical protein
MQAKRKQNACDGAYGENDLHCYALLFQNNLRKNLAKHKPTGLISHFLAYFFLVHTAQLPLLSNIEQLSRCP